MTAETHPDGLGDHARWGVYGLLIALALGQACGKIVAVNSVNLRALDARREDRLQRPFLSGNDRSRWMAIRALAENGNHEINPFLEEPTWDTIDMVKHANRKGEERLYSSKPPLLMVLLAGPYWVMIQATGMTLGSHPYELGRALLLLINGGALLVLLVCVARLVERWSDHADIGDFARVLAVALASFGTLLSAFTPVLNNHLLAAATAAFACDAWSRLAASDQPMPRASALAGATAALTAAFELPALSLLVFFGLSLAWRRPLETLCAYLPAALLVVAAFFATTYWAHNSWRPPYAHRSATDPTDNWYDYEYTAKGRTRDSYWRNPDGIDRGEESLAAYTLHSTIGHHGVLSLTPAWLLTVGGTFFALRRPGWRREFTLIALTITAACLVFYLGMRPQPERNYGGATSGFRWLFWLAPLWTTLTLGAAERLGRSALGRAACCVLLALSALSASYPTWNPWSHPWLYRWMEHLGFMVL